MLDSETVWKSAKLSGSYCKPAKSESRINAKVEVANQIVIDAETDIWWPAHQLVQGYPVQHYHQQPRQNFLPGFLLGQVWTKQTV